MRFLIYLYCLLMFFGCVSKDPLPEPPQIVAFVNGFSIKTDDLKKRMEMEMAKYEEPFWDDKKRLRPFARKVLDRMIEQMAIVEWGKTNGIVLSSEEKALGLAEMKRGYTPIEFEKMLKEKNMTLTLWSEIAGRQLAVQKVLNKSLYDKVKISQQEMQRYYQTHADRYTVGDQVRVRHIVTDTRKKADKIYRLLLEGENFAKLALLYSLSPEKSQGGDLGYFARGSHPQEFDETCFGLQMGELSSIVQSPYGYHIFKLIGRRGGRTKPFNEVKGAIREELTNERVKNQYKQWHRALIASMQIQIIDESLESL